MYRKTIFNLCLVVFSVAMVATQDNGSTTGSGEGEAKMLSGMSILGNHEAPMSLFIVPWKSSELGGGTNLSRTLNERDVPVDREVFMREVNFYRVSADSKSVDSKASGSAAGSRILN